MEFSLQDASRVFPEASVSDLRNWIKRGILRNVGPVPPPGVERRFNRVGMYELGLILSISKGGLMPLPRAAEIVQDTLQARRLMAIMGQAQKKDIPFEVAAQIVDSEPEQALCYEWRHRDIQRPCFWVFVFDRNNHFHLHVAESWGGIEKAARMATEACDLTMLNSCARDAPPPKMKPPSEEFILTEQPYIHVFNITAALYTIDQAIREAIPSQD